MITTNLLNPNKETFVIVDANAFVHSSFHGYEPKLDIKGKDQRVMHGLLNALVDLSYRLERIDYLFFIFDPDDGSLFRKSQYPAYKQNRPPTDPDLVRQRQHAQIIFKEKLGIPMVTYPGYEADDIIGSLANIAKNEYQVVIVSPDKDLAQLVDDNVFLLRRWRSKTERGYTLLNKALVKDQFGIHPHQIPDWLALMGDAADNLPGLYKVGEKTAVNLLSQYPTLEHLLSIVHHLDDEKLKQKVLDAQSTLPLVKRLATIVIDLPLEEHTHEALHYAHTIRTHHQYKDNIFKLEKYFRWPEHYKGLFLD